MVAASDAAAGGCDGWIENTIASKARVDYRWYILWMAFSNSEKPSFGGLFAGRILRRFTNTNDFFGADKRILDVSIMAGGDSDF